MLLGNGRVGKTQICRRLEGQEYDETVPSTHGVKIGAAALTALRDPATLRIWDFGGQDIYHGTHALFLKSRAIFMLVWTPEWEGFTMHDYGGFTFRNQPLGYWLDYVREFGGEDTPVIVVQTQCDLPEQERLRPPVADEALDAFPFKKVLHYSAKENRGRATLDEALAEAVQWLRRKQGVAVIGAGRAAVKARLEEMYAEGKQLISQDEFLALCEEAGNVSSPPLLLDYLHNIGAVFYREGLFGDAIILDQAWALDAVYAVFHRESKAFKNIERYGGRFRRSDLAEWVWQEHSVAGAGAVSQLHAAMRDLLHLSARRQGCRGRVHRARSASRPRRSRDCGTASPEMGRPLRRGRDAHFRAAAAGADALADFQDRRKGRARRRILARRLLFLRPGRPAPARLSSSATRKTGRAKSISRRSAGRRRR